MSRTRNSGTLSQSTPTTQTNSVLSKMSTIIGDKRDSAEASEVNSVQTRSAFFTENKEITVRGNSSKSSSGTILTKTSTTQVSTDVQDVRVDSDVTGKRYHYLSHVKKTKWKLQ